MTEASLVPGATESALYALSPEQASAKLAELTAAHRAAQAPSSGAAHAAASRLAGLGTSPEWRQKFFAGDLATRGEFDQLTAAAAGLDAAGNAVGDAARVSPMIETVAPGELPSRDRVAAVDALRDAGFSGKAIEELLAGRKATPQEHEAAKAFQRMRTSDSDWTRRLLAGDWSAQRELMLTSAIMSAEIEDAR